MWDHLSSRYTLTDADRKEFDLVYEDLCSDTRFFTGAVYAYGHIVICFTGKLEFDETSVWKNKSVTRELLAEVKENLIHEYTHHLQYILLNRPAISDKLKRIDW